MASKKKRQVIKVESSPGKICPNCGEEYQPSKVGSDYIYLEPNHEPHATVLDCIRYLRQQINDLRFDLQDDNLDKDYEQRNKKQW